MAIHLMDIVNIPVQPGVIASGSERSIVGFFAMQASYIAALNDILLLPPIPSGATVQEISLAADDFDSSTGLAMDVGFTDQLGRNLAISGTDSR